MVLSEPIVATAALSVEHMTALRQRMIFECCKWDHQVGDVAALADFALQISPACWAELSTAAERLYRETIAVENEIAADATLLRTLELPRALTSALSRHASTAAQAAETLRVMRFDFHPTAEGWRISEVNSDVPGGYIEAAGFAARMAVPFSPCAPSADPVARLAQALRARCGDAPRGALAHATAYVDDRQVMLYLQKEFRRHGIEASLASPADIAWHGDRATLGGATLDFLFRFFPAEWLPNLRGGDWRNYFRPTATLQINPGLAAISQSKRFPLAWPRLRRRPETWSALLPETIAWRDGLDETWVCKPAFGRVGDGIGLHGATTDREWKEIRRSRAGHPQDWIAQKRFVALPCATPAGPAFPCLGVYVIDGRAAGIYGRIARRALIDHHAQDVAVLVAPQPRAGLLPLKAA